MKNLKWYLSIAVVGYVVWNSEVRTRAIEGISWVARAIEQLEIERLVQGLGDLDLEAMAIDDEIDVQEALLKVLPDGPQSESVRRRISDLKSRTAATQVAKGTTVAAVDQLIEPARETVNKRALAMGYAPENTTLVVVQEDANDDHISDNQAEKLVPQPDEPIYVNSPKPAVNDDDRSARHVKVYVHRVVPARTARKGCCGR